MNPSQTKLLPLTEPHLESTFGWLQDPELRAQIDSLAAPDRGVHFALWRERFADRRRRDFAILIGDRHVGNCGLINLDVARAKAELWIFIAEGRGTGVGAQALQSLLNFGFRELKLNRIYLRVLADNPRAVAFYERHGFVREGVARADSRHADRFIDAVTMAILRSDYHE